MRGGAGVRPYCDVCKADGPGNGLFVWADYDGLI
jgi:hypothetical protein